MLYEKTDFVKNKKGKWVKKNQNIVKNNMTYGKWKKAQEYDKQDKCSTYLVAKSTRSGMNKKVTRATTYFNDFKEKTVYKLITTSNKLPKSYLQGKRKIKGRI